MTDYNKIITTVNSITPDYDFIPDLNNTIVIDTSENRIGINTITPDENIHVSGGTIKTKDLIVLGDFSLNYFSSNALPHNDLSYNLGSITHRWNDLFIGSGSIYMDKTRILRMADYTRHGNPSLDISALIIDNSGQHLDISDIRHVNVEGDVSFASNFDLSNHMIVHGDVSFNKDFDVNGVLNLTQLLTSDGLVTTGTKIYTVYETNSAGSTTTRLIIDPSGDGIAGNAAAQGEVVIYGNLDVKGETTYLKSTNVEISDNIIRMNANHNSVSDGGIAVTNSSNVDKLFTYNNPGNYWTTTNTDINLGPNGGVVTSGFMNIDNVNIDGNTIDVDSGDLILKSDTGQVQMTALQNTTIQSQTGQVVVENVTFNSNTISTDGGLDLNIHSQGGDIFTQNTNLDLGTGILTVNSVQYAHVPSGAIIIWFGDSTNVPSGWVICDGNNGTPNLSGRFVVCAGNNSEGQSYNASDTGGQDRYAFSIQEMPVHDHGGSSGNTSAEHNHPATSNSGNNGADHFHTYSSVTGALGQHSHSGNTGSTSHAHTHEINDDNAQHAHPVGVNFSYSHGSGSGADWNFGQSNYSIALDDQHWGNMSIFQTGVGNLGQGTAGAAAAGEIQVPHNHGGNTAANTGGHSHPLEVDFGGTHAHNVSGNTSGTSASHDHTITTNIGNQSVTHNHPISTSGGGTQHDNRPKWYSLFYIMKT